MQTSRTVLLVEDEPDVRDAMACILERAGYEVVASGDGAEAMELVRAERPDLVVTDLLLPNASGFQILRAAKEQSDDRIPVIMISGQTAATHQEYAFALGADRFLPKPFAAGRFLDVVAELCPWRGAKPHAPTDARGSGVVG